MEPTDPVEQDPKITKQAIPWGPMAAVLVTVFTYLSSQFLAGIAVSIYPLLRGWNSQQLTDWLNASPYGQFIFVVLVEAITLAFIALYMKRRRATRAQIGLKSWRLVDAGYALSGFACYFVIYIGGLSIIQKLIPTLNTSQKQDLGFNAHSHGWALLIIFISLVLLPPITEEIVARGFLYTGLRSKLPKVVAAVITSILFATAHLQIGSGNSLLWVAAIDTFILSLVLVYLREKTDSLAAPMMLHMLKNGIAFMSLFVLHLN